MKNNYFLLKIAFCIIIATGLFNITAVYAQVGITWTSRTSAGDNFWVTVTYGNGLYVAVSGSAGAVMTSPDGITWTLRSAPTNAWQSVTYGAGLFVAVANNGTNNRVMTSPDGITWTSRTTPADNFWQGVTFANGLFVAVAGSGTGNRVMTSPNGITWTIRSSAADNQWSDVTYGNGLFVAVAQTGTNNRVMTSPNGTTWTIRTSAANNFWNAVTYGNGVFSAVSSAGAMTSTDGIAWTIRTTPTGSWSSVVYGLGLFVATDGSGSTLSVMTSPNGTTWTQRTAASANQWNGLTYGNGVFVAVAGTGTGNRVMTSGTFGVVPVKLLSFSGIYKSGTNQLQWQTATETNSKYFEIERSTDGIAFNKIGLIESTGNSSSIKSYNFTDTKPLNGINYYRLKQTDLDGKFEYSNIITLTTKGFSTSVFPNPASNTLTIHTGNNNLNSIAQLYSITGKLEQTINIKSVDQAIDISRLTKGVYTIRMINGAAVQFVKE